MFLKTLLSLALFALYCHLPIGRSECKILLPRRISGNYSYPNHRACDGVPSWELRVHKKQSVRYVFTNMNLGSGSLVIQQKKWARQPYVTRHVISGNMTQAEAVIESPYKFSIVKAMGAVRSFYTKYDVFFCPMPGPSVRNVACSRGWNAKYSSCLFQCNQPEYYPRSPRYMHFQESTCRGNRQWSVNPSLRCMTMSELERLCYLQEGTCPFSPNELLGFFSESDPLLVNDPSAPIKFVLLPPIIIQPPPPPIGPGVAEGRVQPPIAAGAAVSPQIDWDKFCLVRPVCNRASPTSKEYATAKCGDFPAEDTLARALCMVCRFVTFTCNKFNAL